MSSTNTTNATGAKVATNKRTKTATGESIAKTSPHNELLPQEEALENGTTVPTAETESAAVADVIVPATKKVKAAAAKSKPKKVEAAVTKSKPKKVEAGAVKSKTEKVAQKVAVGKSVAVNTKKIKLAASTYHYYRNWLAEFMRSHGVPSAKFQKSPESYNGHIVVVEAEKAKGIKALEQWSKQNPDTKDLFWDVKK